MFQNISEKFQSIFLNIQSRGILGEKDINEILREIRLTLIEADVPIVIIKDFLEEVKNDVFEKNIVHSITSTKIIIEIIHERFVKLLTSDEYKSSNWLIKEKFSASKKILLIGLPGSGKTTTVGKLAYFIKNKIGSEKILLVSLDTNRFAAQEQLLSLSKQIPVDYFNSNERKSLKKITEEILEYLKKNEKNFDFVLFDTAGLIHNNQNAINELVKIKDSIIPDEIFLVMDSMTGQDSFISSKIFHEKIGITGIILTRIDSDTRGGAAISTSKITGKPIKFVGTGEKIDTLEVFDALKITNRILGVGNIFSIAEKAIESMDSRSLEMSSKKLEKGDFSLNDMKIQLEQILKIGGFNFLVSNLPNYFNKWKNEENINNNMIIKKQIAIIQSMTLKEKLNPKILNGSRKRRIALGSGVRVSDVNTLIKRYEVSLKVIKQFNLKNSNSIKKSSNIFKDKLNISNKINELIRIFKNK